MSIAFDDLLLLPDTFLYSGVDDGVGSHKDCLKGWKRSRYIELLVLNNAKFEIF